MKGLKSISDTEDGLDVLVGIRAEFLAEAAHVDVERTGADLRAVAPDAHQQRLARNNLAGMLDEEREQVVFLAGEDHALGVENGGLLREVEREVLVAVGRHWIHIDRKRSH